MSRTLFVVIFATALFLCARSWRRIVAVTLIATVMAGMVFPPTAYAQFGLLGSIQNIVTIINGAIRSALNTIGAVSRSLEALHQRDCADSCRARSGHSKSPNERLTNLTQSYYRAFGALPAADQADSLA